MTAGPNASPDSVTALVPTAREWLEKFGSYRCEDMPPRALASLLDRVRQAAIETCAKECEAVEDRNKNAEGLKLWPVRECIVRVRALLSVSKEGGQR